MHPGKSRPPALRRTVGGGKPWEAGCFRASRKCDLVFRSTYLPDAIFVAMDSPRPSGPTYVGGGIYAANQSVSRWFNPVAFANPATGTFGNLGYDVANGPIRVDVDIAVAKQFTCGARTASYSVLTHSICRIGRTSSTRTITSIARRSDALPLPTSPANSSCRSGIDFRLPKPTWHATVGGGDATPNASQ
jgi:hypothetical protein